MAGYGNVGAYGSANAVETILRMVAQKQAEDAAAQARADKLKQQDFENSIRSRQTATDEGSLSFQRDEANAKRLEAWKRQMEIGGAVDAADPSDPKSLLRLESLIPGGNFLQTPRPERPPQVLHGLLDKNGKPITRVENPDGSVTTYPEYKPPAAPQSEPLVQVQMPDGSIQYVPRSQAAGMNAPKTVKPPTGEERQTRDYYTRMRDALDAMNAVEDKLSSADIGIIQSSPLPDFANNLMLSEAGKKYAQALRSYTLAKLRKESGAAISAGEFSKEGLAAARNLNDTPEVLAQKRAMRERVAQGFAASSGKAYDEFYGKPFAPNTTGAAVGGFIVKDPNGKEHHFDTQAQADAFKKLIGG